MNLLRRAVFAVFVALSLLASPAQATAFSVDQSDLWFIPTESGWGLQLVQRGSVVFGTMFVYGISNAPTWYVATMLSTGPSTWSGDLYATTGPYFGTVPFNPANASGRIAGKMMWTAQTLTAGTLAYTVDGVAVTKNVVRESLVPDDFSGSYLGAFHSVVTNCTDSSFNGSGDVAGVTFTVVQTGSAITLTFAVTGATTITGTLTQDGQFGRIGGNYTDTGGDLGTATVSSMIVQMNSLTASFSQDSTVIGCHIAGYFAAMRSGS